MEVINDGVNGLLVDFFSPTDLANAIDELLKNPSRAAALATNARETVVSNYSLDRCLPKHLSLMQLVADHAFD